MKFTEGHMVVFKAWCYYIVAQLTPLAGLLTTAADDHTNTWPTSLQFWSCLISGFMAGVIAVRAFLDNSHSNYTNKISSDEVINSTDIK